MTLRSTPCPFVLGDRHCGVQLGVDYAGPGCDKTIATCREVFDNEVRFGGAPDFRAGGLVGPRINFDIRVAGGEAMLAALKRNRDQIVRLLGGNPPRPMDVLDWKLSQW